MCVSTGCFSKYPHLHICLHIPACVCVCGGHVSDYVQVCESVCVTSGRVPGQKGHRGNKSVEQLPAAGPNVIHRNLCPSCHPSFSMGACRGPASANTCTFTSTDTHMCCLAGHSHVWSSLQQAKEVKGHVETHAEHVWVQIKHQPLGLKPEAAAEGPKTVAQFYNYNEIVRFCTWLQLGKYTWWLADDV